jgi:hypothetical protein
VFPIKEEKVAIIIVANASILLPYFIIKFITFLPIK